MTTQYLRLCVGLALLLAACAGAPASPTTQPLAETPAPTVAPIATLGSLATLPPAPTETEEPAATTIPAETAAPSPVEYVSTILGDPYPLTLPYSIAFDSQDNLYVADSRNNRIQVFDPNGKFLAKWDKRGSGEGEFNFQRAEGHNIGGVAIDALDQVFVVDPGNYRVEVFDTTGAFISQWGSQGAGDDQFLGPLFAAVGPDGSLYVDDDGSDTVRKFDANGVFITKWGRHGAGQGEFNGPGQLAVDSANNVYVVDYGNNRVEKFDGAGQFLFAWGNLGEGDNQFNAPSGIVVDADDNVYVSNIGPEHGGPHNWVQKFNSDGAFLGKWGSYGSEAGQFSHASGLGIDHAGNIYVVDTTNNRIQKFRPK